jgi:hypothetical protein
MSDPYATIKSLRKENQMSNILRSQEIINAITEEMVKTDGFARNTANNIAYAKAFGFAWAILSEADREMMLEHYLGTDKTLEL